MDRAAAIIGAAALALVAGGASADEFEEFANARNAYEAGDYETAVPRLEEIRAKQPKNKGLVEEVNKLLAVSYLFLGNQAEAEKSFIEILTDNPDFALDPLMFPIDVTDFFTAVKARHAERLAALSAERAAEEAARRAAEEKRKSLEAERLKRNVYLGRDTQRRSPLVALMPFGAGQFQNGHTTKGSLFLAGELLLTAAAVTTFALHESLRRPAAEPIEGASELERYERLEKSYRIANTASVAALAALAAAGIIDSLIFFRRETVSWRRLNERDVPAELRPKPPASAALAPFAAPGAIGLAAEVGF